MIRTVPAVIVFSCLLRTPALCGAELKVFKDVVLSPNPSSDGDSLRLDLDGRTVVVRLYFVDCPETSAASDAGARRVREQARYFGVPEPEVILDYGQKARAFTAAALAEPFTVYTAFASAPGRSRGGRYYAFVQTASGHDLGALLVKNGLARNHGLGRGTPGGLSREETDFRLADLELAAMMKRAGIWAASDPDRIVELRAEQRREEAELERIRSRAENASLPHGRLDVNHATRRELQLIKGIGPVLAGRIIAERPFERIEDLIRVRGIGPGTLEVFRDQLKAGAK